MVNTYKCPGCGASLEYRPGAGELVCEYCGTHVSVSDLDSQEEHYRCEVENEAVQEETRQDFQGYTCKTCGAHLITDEHTTATVCCYCGSSGTDGRNLTTGRGNSVQDRKSRSEGEIS